MDYRTEKKRELPSTLFPIEDIASFTDDFLELKLSA